MTSYRVAWVIDIEADSPREAAELARKCQEPDSSAVCFEVTDQTTNETVYIDLEMDDEN